VSVVRVRVGAVAALVAAPIVALALYFLWSATTAPDQPPLVQNGVGVHSSQAPEPRS
jgi:cytochrome c-type biogenesis protein CcmH/NrfG